MTAFDDLPIPDGDDPIDAEDPEVLRVEILRLRDGLLAANGRMEVLGDRIDELEGIEATLHATNTDLHTELARNPLARVVRAGRRLLRGSS